MCRSGRTRVLRRREDAILLGYLALIYAVLITFFFLFSDAPLWGRVAMVWVGAVLAGRIEAILHWTTHHPAFRSRHLNRLHRLCYAVVPAPAIWYRYLHFHHHRFDNSAADCTSTLEESDHHHQSLPRYLVVSLFRPNYLPMLLRMKPAHRREFWFSMALTAAIAIALLAVDARATLLYWLPVTWLGSALIVALYNYTDHVPGDPRDPLRYATYADLCSPYRRLLSFFDLHNVSTHVTHHRFPGVYWADLPARQAAEEELYRDHGTPRSRALNSGILFNPLAFLAMVWRVGREREAAVRPPHTPL